MGKKYPPLPGTPTSAPAKLPPRSFLLPSELFVPAPGPDTLTMIPDAKAQIQAISQVQKSYTVPTDGRLAPSSRGRQWESGQLWYGYKGSSTWSMLPPLCDTFTLYFLATLSRIAYTQNPDAVAQVLAAFDGATFNHYGVNTAGLDSYDVWQFSDTNAIVAFPGTVTLDQWLNYLPPMLDTVNWLPSGWKIFSGINKRVQALQADVTARLSGLTGSPNSLIFTGHSVGGAVANALQHILWSSTLSAANTSSSSAQPVVGCYTFGAPAWAAYLGSKPITPDWLGHVRVTNPGDPIPSATQLYLSQAASVLNALRLTGVYFQRAPMSTRHLSEHEIPLARPPQSLLNRIASDAYKAVIEGGPGLAGRLVLSHGIRNYVDGMNGLVVRQKSAPLDVYTYLSAANAILNKAGG